ncbi:MAG: pilus assembly protein TadG-related protein [Geminicoccaceae bacterium]
MRIALSQIANLIHDDRGGVAMVIGLCILPLFAIAGLSIDGARGYTAKSKLQGAVDAAALAGGKAHSAHEVDPEGSARMFFDANYADRFLDGTVTSFSAVIDNTAELMTVQAEVAIPTTFMSLFGFDVIPITAEAIVATAHTGLELALVVDVTGSMNWTDSDGAVKIESLKTAGHTLLEAIYGTATSLPDVWISLVPYRAAVNIGHRPSWLTGYNAADFIPDAWRGCVEARDAPLDQDDTPPTGSTDRFRAFHWENGVAWNYWPPVEFDHAGPNWFCPVNEITSLTDQRDTFDTAIDALDARSGGGTQTSVGMVWGWRTISPSWQGRWHGPTPADLPVDYDEPNITKAIVFMTDGIADIGWEKTAYGFLSEGRLGTTNEAVAEAEINNRLSAICEAAKNEGVLVFSVMFAVTAPSIESTYRDCASEPNYFFNSPTGDELEAAFRQIGRRLASLRITS